jgi:hypothetical protein
LADDDRGGGKDGDDATDHDGATDEKVRVAATLACRVGSSILDNGGLMVDRFLIGAAGVLVVEEGGS